MKGLPNLIRLNRWRLSEKRKQLSELERLAAELSEQGRLLEEEFRGEQKTAGASFEARFTYQGYARAVAARRARLAQSAAEVKARLRQALDDVTESFRELKRIEIAQANREQAEQLKTQRAERLQLDELALQQYTRRNGR